MFQNVKIYKNLEPRNGFEYRWCFDASDWHFGEIIECLGTAGICIGYAKTEKEAMALIES